jgi:hypothetical protein
MHPQGIRALEDCLARRQDVSRGVEIPIEWNCRTGNVVCIF